jgi:hypothetical protein
MRLCNSGWRLLSLSIGLTLTGGCGESQPPMPVVPSQFTTMPRRAAPGGSWMLPEAKSQNLLYVSDLGNSYIYAFSYPAGLLVGMLGASTPEGLCVDANGNIFVPSTYASVIVEYAHGGTNPIAILADPGQPLGCAVSPVTGDLAVTNAVSYYDTVVVYRKARGEPEGVLDPGYVRWLLQLR